LANYYLGNLAAWLAGKSAEGPKGEVIEPSFERMRHALWLFEGLAKPEVAERFEKALPAWLRAVCWERIDEIRTSR
jgi:hypothetical protein